VTLVLVHSAGATPAVWNAVKGHLQGIPTLTPALPGRNGAGDPSNDIAAHARAVLAAMDDAGLDRATIAGHSLGGGIALWLALEHPGRVAGLGLVSTGGRLRVNPQALAALPDGLEEAAPVMAASNFPPGAPERLIDERRREYLAVGGATVFADLTACDRFDVLDRLWAIRCRTQVLVGSEDVLTPAKYARTLADRISAARLVVYAGAGHMLPAERPAEVAGELAVLWAAGLEGGTSRRPGGTIPASAGAVPGSRRPG
jgi:pimeloyl-ACP methyl ester carboxylesterase